MKRSLGLLGIVCIVFIGTLAFVYSCDYSARSSGEAGLIVIDFDHEPILSQMLRWLRFADRPRLALSHEKTNLPIYSRDRSHRRGLRLEGGCWCPSPPPSGVGFSVDTHYGEWA